MSVHVERRQYSWRSCLRDGSTFSSFSKEYTEYSFKGGEGVNAKYCTLLKNDDLHAFSVPKFVRFVLL